MNGNTKQGHRWETKENRNQSLKWFFQSPCPTLLPIHPQQSILKKKHIAKVNGWHAYDLARSHLGDVQSSLLPFLSYRHYLIEDNVLAFLQIPFFHQAIVLTNTLKSTMYRTFLCASWCTIKNIIKGHTTMLSYVAETPAHIISVGRVALLCMGWFITHTPSCDFQGKLFRGRSHDVGDEGKKGDGSSNTAETPWQAVGPNNYLSRLLRRQGGV